MTLAQHLRRVGIIVFLLLVAVGMFVGNQRPAQAAHELPPTADEILCYINSIEGVHGPVPIFDVSGCSGAEVTQCSNNIDDDDDGVVDEDDPGCHADEDAGNPDSYDGSLDDEAAADPMGLGECEDTLDNDSDGMTDIDDPDCHTDGDPSDSSSYDGSADESDTALPACWDGIDNDGDGKTDWGVPGDPGRDPECSTPLDDSEGDSGGGGSVNGTLIVEKVFGSGATTPSLFSFTVNGGSATPFNASGENSLSLSPGTYSVVEVASSTYAASYSGCTDVVITDGSSATCTITNTLVSDGGGGTQGVLRVTKVISGGSASAGDFSIHVKSGDTEVSGSPQAGSASGTDYTLNTGSYTVSETDGSSDYTASFSGDCDASGIVSVAENATVTCTITNTLNDSGGGSTNNGGGGGSSQNDEGSVSGGSWGGAKPVQGQVLGAATTTPPQACTAPLLTSYLRRGLKNDPVQVKKLQQFLNSDPATQVAVTGPGSPGNETGFFGPLTDAAVKKFQVKYAKDVLEPWNPFGLVNHIPTGYVYKTTLRKINLVYCANLSIPLPTLP